MTLLQLIERLEQIGEQNESGDWQVVMAGQEEPSSRAGVNSASVENGIVVLR